MKRLRPVLRYAGSKHRVAPWIVRHLPPHRLYLEPFAGGLSVLLAKAPGGFECVNDLDGRVVNFWRVLRDEPEALCRKVALTPWSREEYLDSYEETTDSVEDARRFLVRCWQSAGSMTAFRSGWKLDVRAHRAAGQVWQGLPERLQRVAIRLQPVLIECAPALEIISRHAKPEVCLYIDPPYPFTVRDRHYYRHEMGAEDHEELLALLVRHPGPVLLSTYSNALYSERLQGWDCKTAQSWDTAANEKTEQLWLNPAAAQCAQRWMKFDDD